MYQHLKLFNLNGLKECRLLDLGQINVICGKNNSGKSTLLEAITRPEYHHEGKVFFRDDASKIYNRTTQHMGWDDRDTRLNEQYRNIIAEFMAQPRIWFSDESEIFATELEKRFKSNGLITRYAYNKSSVAESFKSLFGVNKNSVLIPPKRKLELTKQIQGSENISSSGEGILNFIFLARNQPENSPEKMLYRELGQAFKQISGGYFFDVFMDKANVVTLYFSYADQSWIPAGACGLGLQDLLVMLWFSFDENFHVILIEEPESHIHPDMQRRLLSFFREQKDKQYFLTTHSNIFVNNAYIDKVFFTRFENAIKVDDATSRASILNDIGYDITDNLVSDLVILVEGPTDTPVIEEFLIKLGLSDKYNIKIWPLGGDIMAQLDLTVFAQQYKLIALVDKDPSSRVIRKRFTENCKALDIPVHQTQRYAIENYFSLRVLKEIFGSQIPETIETLDPKVKLENQIGINVKKNNRKLAQVMTLKEVEGTDLIGFFEQVEKLCSAD